MPLPKLTYRLVKAGGQTVVRFEREYEFSAFYLTRDNLVERIANLTAQRIECGVELDALAELNQALKAEGREAAPD